MTLTKDKPLEQNTIEPQGIALHFVLNPEQSIEWKHAMHSEQNTSCVVCMMLMHARQRGQHETDARSSERTHNHMNDLRGTDSNYSDVHKTNDIIIIFHLVFKKGILAVS